MDADKKDIYAFGSLCRGEFDGHSDVDLLAVLDRPDAAYPLEKFSVYSPKSIRELWAKGNPFSWHLHLEARLIFTNRTQDLLTYLGEPAPYMDAKKDCTRFHKLVAQSLASAGASVKSLEFDLACVFLALRNFSTCFSLGHLDSPVFSRRAHRTLGEWSPGISDESADTWERCRLLTTRGIGERPDEGRLLATLPDVERLGSWMSDLLDEL